MAQRVLVVVEGRELLHDLTVLLARHGCEVLTAGDAVSAVSVALRERPDVALVASRLPGGSGLTVMERLRALPQIAGLPVIIVGDALADEPERALAAGAAAYLGTPAEEGALVEALGKTATRDGSPDTATGAGYRLLVIDDDAAVLTALVGLLRGRGYEVGAAADGISAVAAAAKQRPDAVVLDLGLPGGDGFTVIERIRGLPQMALVPIIVFTGLEGHRERALAAGAAAFLTKPVLGAELLGTLDEVLRRAAPG